MLQDNAPRCVRSTGLETVILLLLVSDISCKSRKVHGSCLFGLLLFLPNITFKCRSPKCASIERSNRVRGIFSIWEDDTCCVFGFPQFFNPFCLRDCIEMLLKLLPCYLFCETSDPYLLVIVCFLEFSPKLILAFAFAKACGAFGAEDAGWHENPTTPALLAFAFA